MSVKSVVATRRCGDFGGLQGQPPDIGKGVIYSQIEVVLLFLKLYSKSEVLLAICHQNERQHARAGLRAELKGH